MATRWRVLNKRRARKLRMVARPAWRNCKHRWEEGYYGHRCLLCGTFYAHGQAPWEDWSDFADADLTSGYDDWDDGADFDFDDCGMDGNGYCSKAGSEECDWDCPYS